MRVATPRAAIGYERLSRLAHPQMRWPKPGFFLVAIWERQWLMHDRAALILMFGVPPFAFLVLSLR
jgi:hypothetical protein